MAHAPSTWGPVGLPCSTPALRAGCCRLADASALLLPLLLPRGPRLGPAHPPELAACQNAPPTSDLLTGAHTVPTEHPLLCLPPAPSHTLHQAEFTGFELQKSLEQVDTQRTSPGGAPCCSGGSSGPPGASPHPRHGALCQAQQSARSPRRTGTF